MIRFAATIIAVAVCSVFFVVMATRLGWIDAVPSYYRQTAIVLAVFTLVIYRYLYRLDKPETFVQMYLLSMTVKLIGYGAYVILMIIDDKPGANKNVLFFLVLYVVFTALEVAFLYRKIAGKRLR